MVERSLSLSDPSPEGGNTYREGSPQSRFIRAAWPHQSRPDKIQSFRTEAAFELARRTTRGRGVVEDLQEELRRRSITPAGAGRGPVLGMDRRHPEIFDEKHFCSAIRRVAEEHLEPDQPRSRREGDDRGPDDATGPAADRRRRADGRTGRTPRSGASKDTIPEDLRAAIEASPTRGDVPTLGRQNLFALVRPTMKTPAAGRRKIAALATIWSAAKRSSAPGRGAVKTK